MNWDSLIAQFPAAQEAVGGYLGSADPTTLAITELSELASFMAAVTAARPNTLSGIVALDAVVELSYTAAVKFEEGNLSAGFAEGAEAFVLIDMVGTTPALFLYRKPAA